MDLGQWAFLAANAVFLFMSLVILIAFLENRSSRDPVAKKHPSITVVIPAFNEEAHVAKTIRSALSLNYPSKVNVVVVDDGSTDNTLRIARSFGKQGVVVLHKQNGGKASALNYALKRVSTELVACLDADSTADENALLAMAGFFNDERVGVVTPAVKVFPGGSLLQRIQSIEYSVMNYMRKSGAFLDAVFCTPGVLSVFRTGALRGVGSFDEGNLTEDLEIALRLQKSGWRIESCLNAWTYSDAPSSLGELLRQRLRWYCGALANGFKHADMLFNKKFGHLSAYFLPMNYVAALLLVFIIAKVSFDYALAAYRFVAEHVSYLSVGVTPTLAQIVSENADPLYFASLQALVGAASLLLFLFALKISFDSTGERFSWWHAPVLCVYVLFYGLVVGFAWASSIAVHFSGVKKKW